MNIKMMINEDMSEQEGLREISKYLNGYSVFRRILEEKNNRVDHFGNPRNGEESDKKEGENYELAAIARVKMFEIRRLITSMHTGDEKVFLFLHYIHGETMESCAEKLGISYRQVFRLKKRALLMARRYHLRWRMEKRKCVE